MANPIASKTAIRAEPNDRSWRIEVVSQPWTVLALAHLRRPSSVFGPLNFLPPWNRHRDLFFAAGALHRSLVLRDVPSHCLQAKQPLKGLFVVCFLIRLHTCLGQQPT